MLIDVVDNDKKQVQVDRGYARLEMLKEGHEREMEPLTRDIDRLQV